MCIEVNDVHGVLKKNVSTIELPSISPNKFLLQIIKMFKLLSQIFILWFLSFTTFNFYTFMYISFISLVMAESGL